MNHQSTAVARTASITFTRGPMVRISGLPPALFAEITAALTVPNPAVAAVKRFSGWVPVTMAKTIQGWGRDGDDLLIAPGALPRVRAIVGGAGLVGGAAPDRVGMTYSGTSRPYQARVRREVGHHREATIIAPCGSGKTNMGIDLVCWRDVRTLVLVPTREIMKQWVDRFAKVSNVRAATYGGGGGKAKYNAIFGTESVIIATPHALIKSRGMMRLMLETRDHVLVDEGHRTPAVTYTEALAQLDPYYRTAVTATPDREDGLGALIEWWVGPVRATATRVELEDGGFVVRPAVHVYKTSFASDYNPDEPGDYARLMARLYEDETRFNLVAATIGDALHAVAPSGRRHLIRSMSVGYGARLAARLEIPHVHGTMPRVERRELIAKCRTGEVRAIVATTLADEGLDWPELTDVWLVTPLKSRTKVEQTAGRCARPAPDKPPPIIHDFVDVLVSRQAHDREGNPVTHRIFVNMFKQRVKVYREIATVNEAAVREVIR